MSSKRNTFKTVYFLAAFVFVFPFLQLLSVVSAEDLLSRSISLSSSFPSETVSHSFTLTTATPSTIGSISFEYCSNSPVYDVPCIAPSGLTVSAASIVQQTGLTGFTISGATTANNLILTRAPVFAGSTASSYRFENIVNPSASNSIHYVRITVYDGVNGTGSVVDRGSVVFVIDDRFNVELYVPPYLTFCVGVNVEIDCTSVSGSLASFGELSEFNPSTATTQMSVATNSGTGYNLFVNGATMTSGTNIIPASSIQTSSTVGSSQFAINLRANTNPVVGSNPTGGVSSTGQPTANYNSPNLFRFANGDLIASTNLPSAYTRYTVSYIVNISESQAPGIYATTLTYTAVASF